MKAMEDLRFQTNLVWDGKSGTHRVSTRERERRNGNSIERVIKKGEMG
jgi:hypothetical protein